MSDTIQKIGIPIILLIVGLAVGRFAAPTKVEKVEVEKVVDRIVEKKVYVKVKAETKKKKKTTTTIVKKDGTKIIKETEEEQNETKTSEEKSQDESKESVAESSSSVKIKRSKSKFLFQGMGVLDAQGIQGYGASATMRISGPFFGGVWGLRTQTEFAGITRTEDFYGISIGIEL